MTPMKTTVALLRFAKSLTFVEMYPAQASKKAVHLRGNSSENRPKQCTDIT